MMTARRFGLFVAALSVATTVQAQAPTGDVIFKQRCQTCHAVKPGAVSVLAPNLAGIVGRKAAAGKFTYSPALKAANIKWTPATLDKFLAAPTKMVPGTRMVIAVSDPAQRVALIAWLATVK